MEKMLLPSALRFEGEPECLPQAVENQTNEKILKGDYPIRKFLEGAAKTYKKIEEKSNQGLTSVYTIGGEIIGTIARKVLEEW